MRRLLLLSVMVAACQAHPGASGHDARIARVIENLQGPVVVEGEPAIGMPLTDRMAHHRVPGVSLAVVEGGVLAWARGFGVREAGTTDMVTSETRFQAASISKPVAVTGMLRLVDAGRLDLDADVNTYLTSWRVPSSPFMVAEKVTLRRLASHSAGLTVHGFPGYAADSTLPSVIQVLDGARPANTGPVRLDTVPGARWRYSGGGTTVLQLVLSDLTAAAFTDFMAEQVLTPLGMHHSSYAQPLSSAWEAVAARGHRADGTMVPGRWHTYPEQAAAGLWTTPSDLMRWALGVDASRRGAPGAILAPASAQQMLTVQAGSFGLGPMLTNTGDSLRFSHGGANAGYRAEVVFFPATGQGAAIMTNGDNGSALIQEILLALATEYRWPGFGPKTVTRAPVSTADLAAPAGDYLVRTPTQSATIAFRMESGALVLDIPLLGVAGDVLVPLAKDRFISLAHGAEFSFRADTVLWQAGPGTVLTGVRVR